MKLELHTNCSHETGTAHKLFTWNWNCAQTVHMKLELCTNCLHKTRTVHKLFTWNWNCVQTVHMKLELHTNCSHETGTAHKLFTWDWNCAQTVHITCNDMQISPTWKLATMPAFWEAPFRSPRSHRALFPVGSSSTSSVMVPDRRIFGNKN